MSPTFSAKCVVGTGLERKTALDSRVSIISSIERRRLLFQLNEELVLRTESAVANLFTACFARVFLRGLDHIWLHFPKTYKHASLVLKEGYCES
jgi:hypothetical protein